MGSAIGQILPLAIALDISCVAIIAVILMLITPQARGTAGGRPARGTIRPGVADARHKMQGG